MTKNKTKKKILAVFKFMKKSSFLFKDSLFNYFFYFFNFKILYSSPKFYLFTFQSLSFKIWEKSSRKISNERKYDQLAIL